MESANKNKLVQELTLLLVYLSAWEEKTITGEIVHRAWKGYDFTILDQLKESGLIDFSFRAKSLSVLEEGTKKA